jgi:hypothetical protein
MGSPKHADFGKRHLWNEGVRFTLDVKLANDATTAREHGEMKR